MNHAVISCCNGVRWEGLQDGGASLILLDLGALTVTHTVNAKCLSDSADGVTGICRCEDGFAINLQGRGHTKVAKLNRHLKLLELIQTSKVKRPHSLIAERDELLIVSSGTDSVVRLAPPVVLGNISHETIEWSFRRGQRTVHVNSICKLPSGESYITAFGSCDSATHSILPLGFVMNISNERFLLRGLFEPHSLTYFAGNLFFCESRRGVVRDIAGRYIDLSPGYVRGLAVTQSHLYVGISEARDFSISQSSQKLRGDTNAGSGAEIRIFAWHNCDLATSQEIARVDLRAYAREIFDILLF